VFAQWKFECRVLKLSVPRALGGTHRLKPDPLIPRHHGSKQNRQIANGARPPGFNFPILIDRNGYVIAVNEPANKVRFPSTTRGSG
jgi:hypothetical protein